MTKKNDKDLKGEATLDRIGGLVVDLINGEADKDGLSKLERDNLHVNFAARYLIAVIETYFEVERQDWILNNLIEFAKIQLHERRKIQN